MHIRIFAISIFTLFLFVAGCSVDPPYDLEPVITSLDIQPKVVREFQDTIIISVGFTDGDGNLGDDGNKQFNLFVKDNRPGIPPELATISYILPNLTPDAKNPAITGVITIQYPPTAILNGQEMEKTTYDVRLVDRAGNESKTETSDTITIIR